MAYKSGFTMAQAQGLLPADLEWKVYCRFIHGPGQVPDSLVGSNTLPLRGAVIDVV